MNLRKSAKVESNRIIRVSRPKLRTPHSDSKSMASPTSDSAAPDARSIAGVLVRGAESSTASGSHVFVLELHTASGERYCLRQRYSSLLRLDGELRARQPRAAASLPEFPPKYRLSRQTTAFLDAELADHGTFLRAGNQLC